MLYIYVRGMFHGRKKGLIVANVETVKQILALQRQAANARAMAKRGLLTQDEALILEASLNDQIAVLRGQQELPGVEPRKKM